MSPGVPAEVGTGIEYQMLMAVQRWYRPAPEAQPLFRIDPTKGPGSQWQPSPIVDNRGHCFVRNFAEMELIPLGSSLRTGLITPAGACGTPKGVGLNMSGNISSIFGMEIGTSTKSPFLGEAHKRVCVDRLQLTVHDGTREIWGHCGSLGYDLTRTL
eukprot:1158780-Pelagomonas_calceolata.AAC.19